MTTTQNHQPAMLSVLLPSGNRAIYAAPPPATELVGPGAAPMDEGVRARLLGIQIAHQFGGRWYEPGGVLRHAWHEITDQQTLDLINSAREV